MTFYHWLGIEAEWLERIATCRAEWIERRRADAKRMEADGFVTVHPALENNQG